MMFFKQKSLPALDLSIKKRAPKIDALSSGRQDSNLRPPGPKPGALPACATSRGLQPLAVREGFEPSVQFDPYGSLANYWF